MRFLLFLNFLFSVYFLSACMSRRSAEVIEALELAGRNRSELECVLDHYAACEADSLKLRAAEFLIANMPGHQSCSCDSPSSSRRRRRRVDSSDI